ncbi:MAG: NAD-dependent epimerase/dehydratase family protein, partial [Ktedonobacterales bacterium]
DLDRTAVRTFRVDRIEGDVRDHDAVKRALEGVDRLVHLAAAVGVKMIVDDPVHGIVVNVQGTHNVLKSAGRYNPKVIVASSSEVYGKGVKIPFTESDDILLGPSSVNRWSYAASKMVDEFLALGYARQYGVPAIVVRLFNTVGPRQTGAYGMVIPRLTTQALRGEPLTIYGDGAQQRCFCDVRDVARALLGLAAEPRAVGQVFNVGGREEVSIAELAARILAVTESASNLTYVPYAEAYNADFEDIRRRVPNIARIEGLIGWTPRIPLDTILKDVRDSLR